MAVECRACHKVAEKLHTRGVCSKCDKAVEEYIEEVLSIAEQHHALGAEAMQAARDRFVDSLHSTPPTFIEVLLGVENG